MKVTYHRLKFEIFQDFFSCYKMVEEEGFFVESSSKMSVFSRAVWQVGFWRDRVGEDLLVLCRGYAKKKTRVYVNKWDITVTTLQPLYY